MTKVKNDKMLIASLILLIIFIFFVFLHNYFNVIDDYIYSLIKPIISSNMTNVMQFITFFSDPIWCILLSCLIVLLVKNKKISKAFLLNLICVFLLNYLLKIIFARSRPIDINLIVETGFSFPSGHAMISLGIYGFLIYLLLSSGKNKISKIIGTASLILLIFLIGISRIYLGVHYATDVIAGFIISASYLLLFIRFIYPKIKD